MIFFRVTIFFLFLNCANSLVAQSNCIASVKAEGTQMYHRNNIGIGPITTAVYFAQGNSEVNLTYQWYENIENKNIGGRLIDSANLCKYTPSSEVVGTFYYYCVVSSPDLQSCGFMAEVSNPIKVVVLEKEDNQYINLKK